MEQGVRLEGGIAGRSYIVLNDRGVQQLKDNSIREGDILHIFPAMTGG